ncbi:Sialin [Strongyloides ratti]|uniref:Sialin n=1 Tax=Strongyloides ratti TaxID=34506 RepID=A0A090MN99_STRRB|nr:Sialin [Strongyloides ratti]CEF59541.1 Sialin [Strongyloides ratti]
MKEVKNNHLDHHLTSLIMEEQETKSINRMSFFNLLSRRFHVMIFIMLGYSIMVFAKINLSITMTCMVNSTSVILKSLGNNSIDSELTNIPTQCLTRDHLLVNNTITHTDTSINLSKIVNDYGGTLEWNTYIQSIIISGTFWGALLTVLPSGFLVEHFSPKIIFLLAGLTYAATSAIFPFLAENFTYQYAFFDRLFMGLGEGFLLPAANTLISRWIPKVERGTAATMLTAGNQIAGAAGNPISGFLCSSSFGWQAVFYLCSIILTLWAILFGLAIQSRPCKDKWMTEKERKWLEKELNHQGAFKRKLALSKIPFMSIFTSLPFLAVILNQFAANVVIIIIQFYIPTFFKEALYLKVSDNGIISASPHIIQFFAKFAWSTLLEKLQKNNKITSTTASKMSQLFSGIFVFISFISIPLTLDCTKPFITIILFIFAASGFGFSVCGYYTSLLNLAPHYTGVLTSISMVVAFLGRLCGPKLVSYFRVNGIVEEWNSIFYTSSILYLITSIFFFIFGSSEAQYWGEICEENSMVEQNKIFTNILNEEIDTCEDIEEIGIINKSTLDISSLNNI